MAICHRVVLVANYILTFPRPFCKVLLLPTKTRRIEHSRNVSLKVSFQDANDNYILSENVECPLDLNILLKCKGK